MSLQVSVAHPNRQSKDCPTQLVFSLVKQVIATPITCVYEPILNLKNTLNQELQPISYKGKLQKTVPVLYLSLPSC